MALYYRLENGLEIGLGAESLETDFLEPRATRSNRSTGPLFLLSLQGNRAGLLLSMVDHRLDFVDGPERHRLIGDAQVDLRPSPRITLTPHTHRSVVYSALDNRSLFLERRSGLVVGHRTTDRLRLKLFYDWGQNEFENVARDQTTRVDDFSFYGAGFELELTRRLKLHLQAMHLEYESVVPELDRSSNRISTELKLAAFELLPD